MIAYLTNLDPTLATGGWNFVFAATFVAAALYVVSIIWRTWQPHYTVRGLFRHGAWRICIGFAVMALGAALRVGGWVPWWAMTYSGHQPEAAWWSAQSYLWAGAGVVISSAGITTIMWPALRSRFGRLTPVVVLLIAAGLFGAGVLFTAFAGPWLADILPPDLSMTPRG